MQKPLAAGRRAFLRKIGRRGGTNRAKQFTRASQQAARACVAHESNVANGRKGGIAYVKKYGKRKLVEQARQYRLVHPSELESIVADALQQIGVRDFEREAYLFPKSRVHHNTGDFVFRQHHQVVYADGAAWHCGKVLPLALADCADRSTLAPHASAGVRDEKMDNYLCDRGWTVLRLSESEIKAHARGTDAGAMLGRLREFLRLPWAESQG